jgi:hypothetical protein
MEHISVAEHLESMHGEAPPSWLVELGDMLKTQDDLDSALAASLAYDLSRDPTTARALHRLFAGYQAIKTVLVSNRLTSIQAHTVLKTLRSVSMKLADLSSPSFGFHSNVLSAAEKEK